MNINVRKMLMVWYGMVWYGMTVPTWHVCSGYLLGEEFLIQLQLILQIQKFETSKLAFKKSTINHEE